jgi:hypothetical protein
MIIKKTWERYLSVKVGPLHRESYCDIYTGWFLLGIIPLFISRVRTRRP